MSNFKVLLNNGVRFVEINGVKYIASTYAEITRTYNTKDEFSSFNDYIAYKLLTSAFFSARAVVKRKLETVGSEFYSNLMRDLYIDYKRDCNPDGYNNIIRELENTRDILNKELQKCDDDGARFLRDRISATIHDLNDLFENGDSQGNGHDLITCALEVLLRVYKESGLMPDNDMSVSTRKGTKIIKVRTYASRAVDNYINALRRNFAEIENNTTKNGDGDGDGDEATEALNNIAYIENAYDEIDSFAELCDKYAFNEKQSLVIGYIVDGFSVAEISAITQYSISYIYKILREIKEIMVA